MEKIGYVYLTTNLINGKLYVGQHLSEGFDTGYKGSGNAIKAAFEKYGWDNFKCEIICWCSTQTQLNEAEDNYIRLLDTMFPNGYNLKRGGTNGRHSKETRKKLSEATKKYFENPENRKKQSEAKKGQIAWNKGIKGVVKHSEETRKKQSEAKKKYYESEENRKKQSEALKSNKNALGHHPTEETRKKQSVGLKKCWENEEYRKKQSEFRKKRYESEENRKKTSETMKKCWKNEEYRKKQAEVSKKCWENEEYRKKQSEAQRNNPKKSKKVYQYTLDGVFLKEWCSVREIQRVLGFDRNSISACCRYKRKSAYDCFWFFEPLT